MATNNDYHDIKPGDMFLYFGDGEPVRRGVRVDITYLIINYDKVQNTYTHISFGRYHGFGRYSQSRYGYSFHKKLWHRISVCEKQPSPKKSRGNFG